MDVVERRQLRRQLVGSVELEQLGLRLGDEPLPNAPAIPNRQGNGDGQLRYQPGGDLH